MQILQAPNWSPIHKGPAQVSNCNNCGKNGHYARVCKQRLKNNQTVRKLTEEETEPNESMSESDESIYHIEEIKNFVEQQKHYTAKIKTNGTPKEFVIDTGSPVTKMPLDEQIMTTTEIQKITNLYQDVNKNEVKFRGKRLIDMEYQSNKQNMEILITERTDVTPLLNMDWMKKFKLAIGGIQLTETN